MESGGIFAIILYLEIEESSNKYFAGTMIWVSETGLWGDKKGQKENSLYLGMTSWKYLPGQDKIQ